MTGVISLGPLAFSAVRLGAAAGMLAVLMLAGVLAGRVSPRFNGWGFLVIAGCLAAGRMGYVAAHAAGFSAHPWRAFALWEGGFDWRWAAAGAALVTLLFLRRPILIAWAAAALGLAVLSGLAVVRLAPAPPRPPLPILVLQGVEGNPVQLAGRDGRPTVLNLWASWCPPCRQEAPMLGAAARKTRDVRFVFADQGEGVAAVRGFVDRAGLPPEAVVLDPAQELSRRYGAKGLPVTLFFSRDGALVGSHFGAISAEQLADGLAAIRR